MKVVAYHRVSTTTQAEQGASIDAQRAKIINYAAAMDLTVVASLDDSGVSAATLERPGFKAALALLEAGAAEGLVICKIDRLTRSLRDLSFLIDKYFSKRYALLSLADNIDTRSASGRMVINLLGTVSEFERDVNAERTRDVLAHLKSQGVRMGRAPLGYEYNDQPGPDGRRALIPVPHELAIIERIRELRAKGKTLDAIAASLLANAIPTKRGGKWSAKTVRDVLLRDARARVGAG